MALVIQQWNASEAPGAGGEFIRIQGRQAGLFSFLLSVIGVDPTTVFSVDRRSLLKKEGSLAGFTWSVTPLDRVSTVSFGYHKPWKKALIIAAVLAYLLFALGLGLFFAVVIAAVIGTTYYFLNKELFVAYRDVGGEKQDITFKRSVIEGQSVDDRAGERIVAIIEMLVLGNEKPRELVADARPSSIGEAVEHAAREVQDAAGRTLKRTADMTAQAQQAIDRAAAQLSRSTATPVGAGVPDKMETKCPDCGAVVSADSAYCGGCGRKLS